jgi:hypothetical protein
MADKSLSDFAVEIGRIKSGPQAWIEMIPEWDTVLEGWNSGIPQTVIQRWLIEECGYSREEATRQRIAHLSKKYPRHQRERS